MLSAVISFIEVHPIDLEELTNTVLVSAWRPHIKSVSQKSIQDSKVESLSHVLAAEPMSLDLHGLQNKMAKHSAITHVSENGNRATGQQMIIQHGKEVMITTMAATGSVSLVMHDVVIGISVKLVA